MIICSGPQRISGGAPGEKCVVRIRGDDSSLRIRSDTRQGFAKLALNPKCSAGVVWQTRSVPGDAAIFLSIWLLSSGRCTPISENNGTFRRDGARIWEMSGTAGEQKRN
jgi:hypothetical protein